MKKSNLESLAFIIKSIETLKGTGEPSLSQVNLGLLIESLKEIAASEQTYDSDEIQPMLDAIKDVHASETKLPMFLELDEAYDSFQSGAKNFRPKAIMVARAAKLMYVTTVILKRYQDTRRDQNDS